MIAFARRDWHGNTVVVVCNFSGVPVHGYAARPARVAACGTRSSTRDAQAYGGSGVGNLGVVHAGANGRASLVLPPLGVLWLRHDPRGAPASQARSGKLLLP